MAFAYCRRWYTNVVLGLLAGNVAAFMAPPSRAVRSISTQHAAIVTGPQGKPAASQEEDLILTLQIIREFHGLLLEDETKQQQQQQQVPKTEEITTETEDAGTTHDSTPEVLSAVLILDELMERLSRPAYAGPLTRIACAAAPAAGHAIKPSTVDSVAVIQLSDHGMELGVLVCEAGDCVNIAIPVTFPEMCDQPSLMEECILDSVDQLDEKATTDIEQMEIQEDNFEQIQSDEGLLAELQDVLSIQPIFPDWWTEPAGMGDGRQLQGECDSVKELLNDAEFQPDILNLAKQQVAAELKGKHENNIPSGMVVTHAAVALVGTSGFLLRANLKGKDEGGDATTRIVDLPIPFPSGQSITVAALRLSVLNLVDDAQ